MNKLFKILYLILITNIVFSKDPNSLFKQSNDYYRNGDYDKSIEISENILNEGQHSFELYYNLGNSYYKIGDIPSSILYYEKAKKINPNDRDLLKNITIANNLLIDKIEVLPEGFIKKITKKILNLFTYKNWGMGAVILSILSFFTFLLYKKSNSISTQKIFFILFIISIFLSLIFFTISINRFNRIKEEGIIFVPNVYIKNEPNETSQDLFILHEGAKVIILKKSNDWINIKISDGKDGWLKSNDIKKI